jgi:hypothetical protein
MNAMLQMYTTVDIGIMTANQSTTIREHSFYNAQ